MQRAVGVAADDIGKRAAAVDPEIPALHSITVQRHISVRRSFHRNKISINRRRFIVNGESG
jgi:hypothetical protein